MLFILLLIIIYMELKERDWQKECYKERGKCGGLHGGDITTNYLSYACIDCPYREEENLRYENC